MEYLALIAAMGTVTYLPRWMPLFFLTRRRLTGVFVEWLELIPAAILAALLVPALVTSGEPRSLDIFRPELWVAVPTFLFAWWTQSLGGTVVVGMLLFWLQGKFF